MSAARKSRRERFAGERVWPGASSSQDFVRLAGRLYEASAQYAGKIDGNCSPYPLAGVPLLVAAFRCLLVEVYAGVYDCEDEPAARRSLDADRDVEFLREHLELPEALLHRLALLYEVRNELAHPAPGRTPDGPTPGYLASLRKDGLLQSTGSENDFVWLAQLQSHRVFRWAWGLLEEAVVHVVEGRDYHPFTSAGLLWSWGRYREMDSS